MKTLLWLLIVVWIGVVAYYAYTTWPAMSLDLGTDEGTRAAYDSAVMWHVVRAALIALAPAALLLLVNGARSRN